MGELCWYCWIGNGNMGLWDFLSTIFCWIALVIGQWIHSCTIGFLSMEHTRRIEQFCEQNVDFPPLTDVLPSVKSVEPLLGSYFHLYILQSSEGLGG